jgi:hypothetical protein
MNNQRSARGRRAGEALITPGRRRGRRNLLQHGDHLRAGNITAASVGSTHPHKNLDVTGGTGSFLCARGRVHLVEYRHYTGSLRILLRWPRRQPLQLSRAHHSACRAVQPGQTSTPAHDRMDRRDPAVNDTVRATPTQRKYRP